MPVAQARRLYRLAGGGVKTWTASAAELLLWELERSPTKNHPDTREEILAFWGVDEALVAEWRLRLSTTPPAPVSPLKDALVDLGAEMAAVVRELERINRRLQDLAHLTEQQQRLVAAIEELGQRIAALEAKS